MEEKFLKSLIGMSLRNINRVFGVLEGSPNNQTMFNILKGKIQFKAKQVNPYTP